MNLFFTLLNIAMGAWNVYFWPNPVNVGVSVFCFMVAAFDLFLWKIS